MFFPLAGLEINHLKGVSEVFKTMPSWNQIRVAALARDGEKKSISKQGSSQIMTVDGV